MLIKVYEGKDIIGLRLSILAHPLTLCKNATLDVIYNTLKVFGWRAVLRFSVNEEGKEKEGRRCFPFWDQLDFRGISYLSDS